MILRSRPQKTRICSPLRASGIAQPLALRNPSRLHYSREVRSVPVYVRLLTCCVAVPVWRQNQRKVTETYVNALIVVVAPRPQDCGYRRSLLRLFRVNDA